MSNSVLNKETIFSSLPSPWNEDLLPEIRKRVQESRTKIVILDDDPTGTQTVHNIPVLTTWDVDSLKKELIGPDKAFLS